MYNANQKKLINYFQEPTGKEYLRFLKELENAGIKYNKPSNFPDGAIDLNNSSKDDPSQPPLGSAGGMMVSIGLKEIVREKISKSGVDLVHLTEQEIERRKQIQVER